MLELTVGEEGILAVLAAHGATRNGLMMRTLIHKGFVRDDVIRLYVFGYLARSALNGRYRLTAKGRAALRPEAARVAEPGGTSGTPPGDASVPEAGGDSRPAGMGLGGVPG